MDFLVSTQGPIDHEYISYYMYVLMCRYSDLIRWHVTIFNRAKNEMVLEILPKESFDKDLMRQVVRMINALMLAAEDNEVYSKCTLHILGTHSPK